MPGLHPVAQARTHPELLQACAGAFAPGPIAQALGGGGGGAPEEPTREALQADLREATLRCEALEAELIPLREAHRRSHAPAGSRSVLTLDQTAGTYYKRMKDVYDAACNAVRTLGMCEPDQFFARRIPFCAK